MVSLRDASSSLVSGSGYLGYLLGFYSHDRRQRVLGPASKPLRRKPRAPHGVQLRLPRRIVPQYGQRGVQCGAV